MLRFKTGYWNWAVPPRHWLAGGKANLIPSRRLLATNGHQGKTCQKIVGMLFGFHFVSVWHHVYGWGIRPQKKEKRWGYSTEGPKRWQVKFVSNRVWCSGFVTVKVRHHYLQRRRKRSIENWAQKCLVPFFSLSICVREQSSTHLVGWLQFVDVLPGFWDFWGIC